MEIELLGQYGIDYKNGLLRCMGDEKLYEKVLLMFLDDRAFRNAEKAYADSDYQSMFAYMHELKGTSGNMGMTRLYKTVCAVVETLRGKKPDENELSAQMELVKAEYDIVYTGIKQLLG